MTAMKDVGIYGGISYDFLNHFKENLNEYSRMNNKNNGYFCGSLWNNISTEEMFHLLVITLNISIEKSSIGGYISYFQVDIIVFL